MIGTNANARPQSMAEEEANSVFSHDEGSSEDETANNGSAGPPRKRKREKHQKTSYVVRLLMDDAVAPD